MLTFASPIQRQRAEILMQPTLIRVIDNLRKELEASALRGTYQEQPMWPPGTTAPQKEQFNQLMAQLEAAEPEEAVAIRTELSRLPQPFPAYELHVHRAEEEPIQVIDVWELCYRVCLDNYHPEVPAKVDANLLEADGDIDWLALDEKAKGIIQKIFQQLP